MPTPAPAERLDSGHTAGAAFVEDAPVGLAAAEDVIVGSSVGIEERELVARRTAILSTSHHVGLMSDEEVELETSPDSGSTKYFFLSESFQHFTLPS